MIKRLKRLVCHHSFHFLASYSTDGDRGVGYREVEKFIIYCPKCGETKEVLKHQYESVMNKQKIDREYRDTNE